MRRILILALLFGGMQLILPLGAAGLGSQTLLTFGFLILAAYTVGEIAAAVALPKIVGYLVAGVIFGPSVLDTVTAAGVAAVTPVSQLAVAMIAFLAGAELRWEEVRERGVLLVKMMTAELGITFVALLYAVQDFIPVMRDVSAGQALAFAVLFASIAIVHSPAVTMALLAETGARGPVARTTLGIVLIADVAVVLLFSAALAFARSLVPPAGTAPAASVGLVLWEIGGALLVGAALGAATAAYLRFVGRELVLFGVLVAFFGLEIARFAHVELLLTLLTAGYVWMGLVSQAGVAIGLASIVAEAYPERGAYLQGMLLALIAINETLGPILFRRALSASGETEEAPPAEARVRQQPDHVAAGAEASRT